MKVLVLDGATRTGYAIYQVEGHKVRLVQYGVIQLNKKKQDYLRIPGVTECLDKILSEHIISKVYFEEVYGRFFDAIKFLFKLQYCFQIYFHEKGIPFESVEVADWHGKQGKPATKRKKAVPPTGVKALFKVNCKIDKDKSIELAKSLFKSDEVKLDDNMADAILIGLYILVKNLNNVDFTTARRLNFKCK